MPISVPIRQVKTIIRLYVTHYTVIKECHDRLMMDYFCDRARMIAKSTTVDASRWCSIWNRMMPYTCTVYARIAIICE